VAVILGWLWGWSIPGTHFLVVLATSVALLAMAVVWSVHLIRFAAAWRRDPVTGRGRRFLLAPLLGGLALALVAAQVPLQARWSASRAAFEEVVADPEREWFDDQRLGLYTVGHVTRRGGAVLFQVSGGGFIDGAGIAHLPDGPSAALERDLGATRFRRLDGPWHTYVIRF